MSSAIQTFSGALVDPLAPDPAQIDPVDVAHALSHHCRFGGHSRVFYSVAQHSCHVADAVEAGGAPVADVLWGLLHDATEAYLGDLPHPLKHRSPLGEVYREAEDRLQAAICARFGLPPEPPPAVKQADRALLATERRALMLATPDDAWPELDGVRALELEIAPWAPQHAAAEFLARMERLEAAR